MQSKLSSIEDAVQDGNLGFIEAINNYKTEKHKGPKQFTAFIRDYIFGTIMHSVSKDWKGTKLNVSIDKDIVGTEGLKLEETLADPRQEEQKEKVEFSSGVEGLLDQLGKREQKIVKLIMSGRSKRGIAEELGITKTQVGRIVRRKIKPLAEKYLMKSESWQNFLELLEDYTN